jgi:hypothetical protein
MGHNVQFQHIFIILKLFVFFKPYFSIDFKKDVGYRLMLNFYIYIKYQHWFFISI